jgi:hypothetical protein
MFFEILARIPTVLNEVISMVPWSFQENSGTVTLLGHSYFFHIYIIRYSRVIASAKV